MAVNLTDTFIDYLFSLREKDIPEHVIIQAKRCLLDYIGVTLAGAKMIRDKGNKVLDSLGDTQGSSTVIGFKRKASLENAVFVNGLSAHVAELDDGINSGIVHLSASILSALLPIAEQRKVSVRDLLVGIITGYETAIRLAIAIQPFHKKKGFHATGTCGTIGTAMGIVAMLRFSKSQMKVAFSAAAVSASGTLKVLEDESELKPFNAGRAANNGMLSAFMAESGFLGPSDVLTGQTGFLSVFTDTYDISGLSNFPDNKKYAIEDIYIKPYAACRYCHPAIEAAIKINEKIKNVAGSIKHVQVLTYELAVNKHDHTNIEGVSSAKMSIPYSVAISLINGKAGIEDYSIKYINDIAVSSLTKKVKVVSSDELTNLFPKKCPAIVKVTINQDESYMMRVDFPKGEPENPLSNTELEEKFLSLAQFADKPKDECQHIIDFIWNGTDDLRGLFHLLSGEEYV